MKKRLITRTAIDPLLGTASAGQLYSQRVLAEDQVFRADVEVPSDLVDTMRGLITPSFTGGIGTGRSRGQGWVQVEEASWRGPRWGFASERFQLASRWKGRPLLVVTLLSDAIFQDDYLRHLTAPRLVDLEPLKIRLTDWKREHCRAFAETRFVFGFDGQPMRLPRVPYLAVVMGSVFCFPAREGVEPQIPDGDGVGWIGQNPREGFGQAILWHPFHLSPYLEVAL